jgi:hypothetical protein
MQLKGGPWIIGYRGGSMQEECHVRCGNHSNNKLCTPYVCMYVCMYVFMYVWIWASLASERLHTFYLYSAFKFFHLASVSGEYEHISYKSRGPTEAPQKPQTGDVIEKGFIDFY